MKARYEKGLLEGVYEKFHEHGKHHVRRTYLNGKMNGKTKSWWSNGKLAEEIDMKDDVAKIIEAFPDKDIKTATTPAENHLFQVRDDVTV